MTALLGISPAEFAARRRTVLSDADRILTLAVAVALSRFPNGQWWTPVLDAAERVFRRTFREEYGDNKHPNLDDHVQELRGDLMLSLRALREVRPGTAKLLANATASAAVNAATVFAASVDEEDLTVSWVTMHDSKVRETHADADGQTVPVGHPFDVGGFPMRYPGDPRAPIGLWVNCRCVVRPGLGSHSMAAAGGGTMTVPVIETPPEETVEVPELTEWHAVLIPEGVGSGDGRTFALNSLRNRDLPLPMTWQKMSDERHKGSVIVGQIKEIFRDGPLVKGSGSFEPIPEADEVIGLIASGALRGVSVDVDDATAEADLEAEHVTFTDARICSAAIVAIPAFAEAFIALGPWEDAEANMAAACGTCGEAEAEAFVSDRPWSDFAQSDYSDDQWYAACCLHRNGSSRAKSDNGLPIKEPGGALNKNGVHSAAGRFNQTQGPSAAKAAAKACLRGAYKALGESPPDVLKAGAETDEFGRGPGWVTNPEATRRLWNYWVHGEGAAKIRWGEPNDFYRCRSQVGEEIGESDPAKLRFINQICAQWHKDALGVWPGQEGGGRHKHTGGTIAASVNLVAAAGLDRPPAEWFTDPHFIELSPLSVTDEHRVFGHIAGWDSCHTAFRGMCVPPPHSQTGYAEFMDGYVITAEGTQVAIGHITMDGDHADLAFNRRRALRHYADTTLAVADVAVGEDQFGVWCAGYIRPGVPEEKVVALRASKLSGDWRDDELILALAVNKPGFMNPRVRVSDGHPRALVAAGMVDQRQLGNDSAQLAAAVADELERRDLLRRKQALLDQVMGSRADRIKALATAAGVTDAGS